MGERIEIEREWLIDVNKIPESLKTMSFFRYILQGYLIADNIGELRLRGETFDSKTNYYLEIKLGTGKIRENPEPIKISKNVFYNWLKLAKGKIIEKIRLIDKRSLPYVEIDFYQVRLKGLIIAEVEFESEEKSNKFIPPEWFGPEVTDDGKYKDKNLAVYGLPKDYPFKKQIKRKRGGK